MWFYKPQTIRTCCLCECRVSCCLHGHGRGCLLSCIFSSRTVFITERVLSGRKQAWNILQPTNICLTSGCLVIVEFVSFSSSALTCCHVPLRVEWDLCNIIMNGMWSKSGADAGTELVAIETHLLIPAEI